jgi:hypothetical protein
MPDDDTPDKLLEKIRKSVTDYVNAICDKPAGINDDDLDQLGKAARILATCSRLDPDEKPTSVPVAGAAGASNEELMRKAPVF